MTNKQDGIHFIIGEKGSGKAHYEKEKYIKHLEQENNQLNEVIDEIKEIINSYMPNEHAICKAFDEIEFILSKTKGGDE